MDNIFGLKRFLKSTKSWDAKAQNQREPTGFGKISTVPDKVEKYLWIFSHQPEAESSEPTLTLLIKYGEIVGIILYIALFTRTDPVCCCQNNLFL